MGGSVRFRARTDVRFVQATGERRRHDGGMNIDLDRARTFLATHGRVLDRRRFEAIVDGSDAARRAIVAGLDLYRNADGGYGWGLEPDFRAAESQPQGAQHALEAFADAFDASDPSGSASPQLAALLDWLRSVTLPDGGLPFALPVSDPEGCAPFFLGADPTVASLQATSVNAAHAHALARRDPRLLEHPWLVTATRYCLDAIEHLPAAPAAYELAFALRFLDTAADTQPRAAGLLQHLVTFVPPDGAIPVTGGSEGERIRPLQLTPEPDRPLRALIDPGVIATDLDRLERGQHPDGGWDVDFASHSSAAALEWRGYATVQAVWTLRRNGRC